MPRKPKFKLDGYFRWMLDVKHLSENTATSYRAAARRALARLGVNATATELGQHADSLGPVLRAQLAAAWKHLREYATRANKRIVFPELPAATSRQPVERDPDRAAQRA